MKLGLGLTVFKRVCREFGIDRWPYKRPKKRRTRYLSGNGHHSRDTGQTGIRQIQEDELQCRVHNQVKKESSVLLQSHQLAIDVTRNLDDGTISDDFRPYQSYRTQLTDQLCSKYSKTRQAEDALSNPGKCTYHG